MYLFSYYYRKLCGTASGDLQKVNEETFHRQSNAMVHGTPLETMPQGSINTDQYITHPYRTLHPQRRRATAILFGNAISCTGRPTHPKFNRETRLGQALPGSATATTTGTTQRCLSSVSRSVLAHGVIHRSRQYRVISKDRWTDTGQPCRYTMESQT